MRIRRIGAGMQLLAILVALAPAAAARPVQRGKEVESRDVEKAIELGIPAPVSVSWTELVVEVPVRIRPVGVGGHVEHVRFSEMRLNGIPFEVEPYDASFELPEDDPVTLPEPLRLRLKFLDVAPGVFEEAVMPSDELRLQGRVTLDGTFRKWIFKAKRTVGVSLDATRPNPLAEYHPLRLVLERIRSMERDGWKLPW